MDEQAARQLVARGAALGTAYVLAAALGHQFAFIDGNVSPFWPAAGVAVAGLTIGGRRLWPGLWVGTVVAHLLTGTGLVGAALIGSGNLLAAVVAAGLLRRPRLAWRADLGSTRDVTTFILAGATVPAAIAATLGIAVLGVLGWLGEESVAAAWAVWWIGDAIGCAVVGALAFTWTSPGTPRQAGSREVAMTVAAGSTLLVLLLGTGSVHEVVAVPVMVYAALRLDTRWTAVLVAVLATSAGWYTAMGLGPFAATDHRTSLVNLAVYFAAAGVTCLVLAAIVSERERMRLDLRAANADLEARVAERTRRLWRQSRHDGLTGLANRVRFTEVLDAAVAAGGPVAVLFVDLDGFKAINDTAGHGVGDQVLVVVARRMEGAVRADDLVARIGGDELAVLLPDVEDPDDVRDRAEQVLTSLRRPVRLDDHDLRIGASIGVAVWTTGTSTDELLRSADTAMYRAKQAGGDRVQVHEPALGGRAAAVRELASRVG